MEITHRQFHRVDLLSLSGRLDAASAPQLREAIEHLFHTGHYRIVLDMQHLAHISSAGLRVLTDARKRAREWKITDLEGGDIRLASVPPNIGEVFNLTGMSSLFAIYDDATAAVGSF
jgi:anti-sigma B factor antagonist